MTTKTKLSQWLCCRRNAGVQVYLRGKAHVEWRITRGGERRTVKEDQYFIDEKAVVWGRGTVDR